MRNWSVKITKGTELRKTINAGDGSIKSTIDTMDKIIECFDEIIEKTDSDISDMFYCYKDDIQEDYDYIKGADEDEYDECEYRVNDWLTTLYDECDANGIWIEL
jgi:hypothetical protein